MDMVRSYNSSRDKKLPDAFKATCSKCHIAKDKIRAELRLDKKGKSKGYYFRDQNGKLWDAGACPSCARDRRIVHGRVKYGHKPIDEVTSSAIKKGRRSERLAEKYFLKLGFDVKITESIGPDLIVTMGGISLTVEVKTALKSQLFAYTVGRVEPNRIKDDLICIIGPDNSVHVESMTSHLSKCSPHGYRSLTDMYSTKEYRLHHKKRVKTKSGFIGVYFSKKEKKYRAYSHKDGKQDHIGYFSTDLEAAKARDLREIQNKGIYARLNFKGE